MDRDKENEGTTTQAPQKAPSNSGVDMMVNPELDTESVSIPTGELVDGEPEFRTFYKGLPSKGPKKFLDSMNSEGVARLVEVK